MKYRVHFEPEDVEANNPEQVPLIIHKRKKYVSIRKVVPIDDEGFPIQNAKVQK
jgi:hypothetical protein